MGRMEPFWTRLPIQSWAPRTTSGPLPAWFAVMKLDWRSLATVWTVTVIPCCSPHFLANSVSESAFFWSAQIIRLLPLAEEAPPESEP